MKIEASLHAPLLLKQSVQDTLQPRNGVRVHVPRKEARLLVAKCLLQRSEVTRAPIGLQQINPNRTSQTDAPHPEKMLAGKLG